MSAAVDPNLQLRDVASLQEVAKREQGVMRVIGVTLIVVMSSVIVLSAAGIYALMSFTVARRRKEIGIRTALGADPSQILRSIFSRALLQLSAGAVLGMIGATGLEQILEGETFQGHGAVILPIVAVLMTLVGLAAAWVQRVAASGSTLPKRSAPNSVVCFLSSDASSPRLARWILERALPADVRDDVSGDVEEMFHRRSAS